MRYVQFGTAALFATVVAGFSAGSCGGAPAPHDKAASSEAAVRSAQEVGAHGTPESARYLQLAQDELEQGKTLLREGENAAASAMLQRAQADAELAVAMARESKTRVAAEEAKARVQALRAGTAPGSAIGGGPMTAPQPSTTPSALPPAPSTVPPGHFPARPGSSAPGQPSPRSPSPSIPGQPPSQSPANPSIPGQQPSQPPVHHGPSPAPSTSPTSTPPQPMP